jgi:hypothetical protein
MTTYDQPVEASLQVKLANGKTWEATAEDMKRFGYVSRSDAYLAFDDHLRELLHGAGLIGREVTDAWINPIRYIAEVAINYPELLAHRDMADVNARIVEIERHLQATLLEEER